MNGKIYVFGCEITGMYKIGRSADPEVRIRSVSSNSGMELHFVYVTDACSNSGIVESEAHKICNHRAKGEWFRCSELEAVNAVKGSFNLHSIPPVNCVDDDSGIKRATWWLAWCGKEKSNPLELILSACERFCDDEFTDEVIDLANCALRHVTGIFDISFKCRDDAVVFVKAALGGKDDA
ncbi:hypothetical protein VPH209E381_0068 [Vibrio phage 209E38-1]